MCWACPSGTEKDKCGYRAQSSLGGSHHEKLEFRLVGEVGKTSSRITALDFRARHSARRFTCPGDQQGMKKELQIEQKQKQEVLRSWKLTQKTEQCCLDVCTDGTKTSAGSRAVLKKLWGQISLRVNEGDTDDWENPAWIPKGRLLLTVLTGEMVDHAVERREVDISYTQSLIVRLQLNGKSGLGGGRCRMVGCLPQQTLSIIASGVKTFLGLNTGMERVFCHRRGWEDGQRTASGSLQVVHPTGRSRERTSQAA